MSRKFAFISLFVVMMLVFAACGGGSEVAPEATEAPAPTEAPAATEEAAAPEEAEEAEATEEPAEEAAAGDAVTIKIATQSPLSGPQSVLGVGIKNGAQLAMEQANEAGIIDGVTFELAPFDDQATPDTGVANATQIVGDPDILCMVGHLNSGVMIASMEQYHTAELAAVSPANTNPGITDRGYAEINRIVGRDDIQGVVGREFASNSMGVESVYLIHDNTAYGQGVAQFFRQSAEEAGMEVLGFEGTEEQANFDGIITPIIAANPDLVYFGGIYSQAGIFFRQARDRGVTAQFMGPDGLDSSELASLAGDAAIDMYYSTVAAPANVYPDAAQFITDYEERFGESTEPFAAQAYDAMNICIDGIKRAMEEAGGVPTRAQVTEAVRATEDYPAVTGSVTFNSVGDKALATYFVLKVISSDPDEWNNNELVESLDIAAPVE